MFSKTNLKCDITTISAAKFRNPIHCNIEFYLLKPLKLFYFKLSELNIDYLCL